VGIKKKTRGWEGERAGTASQSNAIKMLKSGLPYSLDVYRELMASYLAVYGAVAASGLILAIALVFAVWRRRFPWRQRRWLVAGSLAGMWLWLAAVHQGRLMAEVNFMALPYAAGLALQAGLLLFWAAAGKGRDPAPGREGLQIALFAIVLYPLISYAAGTPWQALDIPGTGPNATALFTAGMLLSLNAPLWLYLLPLCWGAIAGVSAYLLGFPADYLVPAGIVIAAALAVRARRRPE